MPHDAATTMCILLCGAGQHATFHVAAGDVGVEGLVTRHGLHAQGVSQGVSIALHAACHAQPAALRGLRSDETHIIIRRRLRGSVAT